MRQIFAILALTFGMCAAIAQESGYQVINGTRVFTQIDHANDTATFSNDCGSQTLTHAQLGAGAIPTNIIPCPRSAGGGERNGCPAGDKSASDGRCIPSDAVDCGNGSYCLEHQICNVHTNKCMHANDDNVCSNGSYCDSSDEVCITSNTENYCINKSDNRLCAYSDSKELCRVGYICVKLPNKATGDDENKCVISPNRYSRASDLSQYYLAVSLGGLFYGAVPALPREDGQSAALTLCNVQRANTSSTPEERMLTCRIEANGSCVALARVHSMWYGQSGHYAWGAASGDTEEEASAKALYKCGQYGDQNCTLVPETVRCSNKR